VRLRRLPTRAEKRMLRRIRRHPWGSLFLRRPAEFRCAVALVRMGRVSAWGTKWGLFTKLPYKEIEVTLRGDPREAWARGQYPHTWIR